MKTKTVIVDDHALFNDGLALILSESDEFAVVGQVYDSRQALYTCGQVVPELVLVDYNMPHLNGLAVVGQLSHLLPRPRLVVISMYAQPRERKLFAVAGVDGYLAKTTPAPALITSLHKIMGGERLLSGDASPDSGSVSDFFALRQQLTKREYEIALGSERGADERADCSVHGHKLSNGGDASQEH